METNKSYLTAIARKQLPLPVKWLLSRGLIHGNVLDYGCGKCAKVNNQVLARFPTVDSVTNYDPHYEPDDNFMGTKQFDTILCTYVICALEEPEELPVLRSLQSLLRRKGTAYVSVRNDKPKWGHGYSSRGTCQRWVELNLPQLHIFRQARIYVLTRDNFSA